MSGMKMSFQDEMKQIFLCVAAGEVCQFMRYYHGLAKKTERKLE